MRNVIHLSGPMGSGIRPKKYFGATKELMRRNVLKPSSTTSPKLAEQTPNRLKTA